ncbi:hypothetical protein L6164_020090 [Bauhinia variegata]|uniref:Uncharacterized protein n=1 Tax=Bauhinia variegata TaxID=167791 RepID=A0ACB9MVZ8_BAUVA|nr:hypothetical protein L6164_020090 [Bauhinia variegata]
MASEEPRRKWRYTWEAQSHVPTLRLLLFHRDTKPSLQCQNLNVHLDLSQSLVIVSWFQDAQVSLRVPIPRVLVDAESSVSFRALDDHIEAKVVLLLPVDHPIVLSFDSVLNLSEDQEKVLSDVSKPVIMNSDVKSLSSKGEADFYCRSCSFKLTRSPLRNFIEMPSVNWREVADNWFGACCCSFGGISEKLVTKYANSYACVQGMCLLSPTSINLCKDDLVECNFPEWGKNQECNSKADTSYSNGVKKPSSLASGLHEERTSTCGDQGEMTCTFNESLRFSHSEDETSSVNLYEVTKRKFNHDSFSLASDSNIPEDVAIAPSCCAHATGSACILDNEDGERHLSETARRGQRATTNIEILANQKSFLNGFLGDIFMARLSNLSKDIDWHEFTCPHCASLLGAYPCYKGYIPVDRGVRMFKCYVSTCLPVGGSGDLFRMYTVEKMFTDQLVECANDESLFRFMVRDLKTKSPSLQVILINPDTWSCSGNCLTAEDTEEPVPKVQLQPIVKVLYSDCSAATESQLRAIEEWVSRNSAENIFMLTYQIEELVGSLMSSKDIYPPSYASLQGLTLSSMQR